jgi:hypothetical protein
VAAKLPRHALELLDTLYQPPDPLETDEDRDRTRHDDLAALTLEQIDAERILLNFCWAFIVHHRAEPISWVRERIARLDAARRLATPSR